MTDNPTQPNTPEMPHMCRYSEDGKHGFISITPEDWQQSSGFKPKLLLTCIACGHKRAISVHGDLYYLGNSSWHKFEQPKGANHG